MNSRLRARGKKTAFQKNLEKLKRESTLNQRATRSCAYCVSLTGKKSGKPISSSESSEEEEETESEENKLKPFKGARPIVDDALFTEDENDSDSSSFIVEDDSQAVTAQLPSEFSMRSHDDLTHQFKIVFQFFVHVAVRPNMDRQSFMENQMKRTIYPMFLTVVLIEYRSGVFLPPFKGDSEKVIRAQRFSCSFFGVATKIQEGARNPPYL